MLSWKGSIRSMDSNIQLLKGLPATEPYHYEHYPDSAGTGLVPRPDLWGDCSTDQPLTSCKTFS